MTASPIPASVADLEEQLARIRRSNAETQTFIEEQAKLRAEAAKFERDRTLAPWQIVATSVAATAALIGGTAAVVKVFFP